MNLLRKEFIWSNRKPRIKHSTQIGDPGAEGSLKNIDIESKFISSKISWMRRLKDSGRFLSIERFGNSFSLNSRGTLFLSQI